MCPAGPSLSQNVANRMDPCDHGNLRSTEKASAAVIPSRPTPRFSHEPQDFPSFWGVRGNTCKVMDPKLDARPLLKSGPLHSIGPERAQTFGSRDLRQRKKGLEARRAHTHSSHGAKRDMTHILRNLKLLNHLEQLHLRNPQMMLASQVTSNHTHRLIEVINRETKSFLLLVGASES